jgi:hypothetical protein
MISDRIKDVIFKKLYKDLGHVEIIRNGDSIWFIDRESKFWYFNYIIDTNKLWWRGHFFSDFFNFFSLNQSEFVPIISSWVEEVLNCKVNTTTLGFFEDTLKVELVLNCKVNTTTATHQFSLKRVDEVLNCKVNTTKERLERFIFKVEEVLDYQVDTTKRESFKMTKKVDEVLNYKVESTESGSKFSPCVESIPL